MGESSPPCGARRMADARHGGSEACLDTRRDLPQKAICKDPDHTGADGVKLLKFNKAGYLAHIAAARSASALRSILLVLASGSESTKATWRGC